MAGDNRPSNVKSRGGLSGFTKATGNEEAPFYLKRHAVDLWDKSIKELTDAGHLQVVDLEILAMYCQAYAHYIELQEIINKPDFLPIYYSDNGYPCPNPALKMANEQLMVIKNLGMKLSFNPQDRIKNKVGTTGFKKRNKRPGIGLD